MKIETKRSLGQEVWLIYNNRPTKAVVEGITVSQKISHDSPTIEYSLYSTNSSGAGIEDEVFVDSDLYETKTKAIESLFLTGDIDHR